MQLTFNVNHSEHAILQFCCKLVSNIYFLLQIVDVSIHLQPILSDFNFSFRLSLLAIFCSLATATILRLPCITVADFKTIYIGRRLKGYVISTKNGVDDMKCTMECVHHFDCRSYNINVKKMLCELNSKAHVDTNGKNLIADTDWIYKSTDFKDLLVCVSYLVLLWKSVNIANNQ